LRGLFAGAGLQRARVGRGELFVQRRQAGVGADRGFDLAACALAIEAGGAGACTGQTQQRDEGGKGCTTVGHGFCIREY
jgi:hypothetical protein